MKKRLVSVLLAITMLVGLLSALPLSASATTYAGTCGDNVIWELNTDTGILKISGSGPMTNYTWESEAPWGSKYASIKTVIIEDGVTGIGDRAFYCCLYVTNVTIPNSVTSIGDYAFYNCAGLTSIAIPSNVTSIGYYAFYSCWELTDITIPDSVTSIGACAFYFCEKLTSITLPNSVTSIEYGMFRDCKNLTSIVIPDSVTSIGNYAFYNCYNLRDIKIPDSVTSIGADTFAGCSSLTSITIPDSVTSIGEKAFYYCLNLSHAHFLGNMPVIANEAFLNCSSDLKLCYMESAKGWNNCTYQTEAWDYTYTTACTIGTYICNDCGESYSKKLDSPSHSYGSPVDNGDGTHTATCVCGDTVVTAHNYVDDICVCGAVQITVDSTLTFGAQLYLENDLTIAFRVKQDKLTAYDISTAYLVVERDVYATGAKEATVETMTISEYKIEGGRLIFSYPGIAAAQMNDSIRATLYVKNAEGKEFVSPVQETSVASYLDGLLRSSASDPKLVTLIMDMVNYGAAAQVYFDRHADAPVNEALDSFKTYASYASSDFETALENLAATENAEGKSGKLNTGLDLGTRIGIQYKVTVPADVDAQDVTLVITDAEGNVLETLAVAGNATDTTGRYIVNFYGSTSRDMRRTVYATAYANGVDITGTYAYSISTYAWGVDFLGDSVEENLAKLTRMMMLYGDSAAAYFA